MKLLFEIEYRTRWGEQLVLLFGRRRIALQYADNGLWRGSVERYADRTPVVYRYAVERDGARIRSEWRPHALVLPEIPTLRVLRIRDRWQEMPADAPFHSSAFTRGIFARKTPAGGGKRHGATVDPETANVTFRIILPTLRPEEVLAVAAASLGNWQKIVPMDDSRFPEWSLSIPLPEGTEYKFLVADRATLAPVRWEDGANRIWAEPRNDGEHRIEASLAPHFPKRRWRGAGTAVPVFSLRSRESFGVGEFADLKLLVEENFSFCRQHIRIPGLYTSKNITVRNLISYGRIHRFYSEDLRVFRVEFSSFQTRYKTRPNSPVCLPRNFSLPCVKEVKIPPHSYLPASSYARCSVYIC